MFIKNVDAFAHIKDAALICELLYKFIQEIGPQNVVQVITDNVANYVAIGKLFMLRYSSLFWTPCVTHCIDLILKNLSKITYIKDIVESARSITKFI
jgi:hypothetical protein